MHWDKVAIVGVGLIGGSIGRALIERKLARRVLGLVRSPDRAADALRYLAVHDAKTDPEEVISDADLVVLCTPVSVLEESARTVAPFLSTGSLVTDVGSVKKTVVDRVGPIIESAGANFIASHPMAGRERVGVRFASESLFEKAKCVLTPSEGTPSSALERIKVFWESIGCDCLTMEAAEHDRLAARGSHVPHIVAAALAETVLNRENPSRQYALCAGGFRDTTRIASGSSELWTDIALSNREALTEPLNDVIDSLKQALLMVETGDGERLKEFFASAKSARDAWRRAMED